MNKTIKSIALLKVIYEKNSDYIDLFIPFIAALISKKDYKKIEVESICADFQQEYGLIIPYHPMQTLIKRAKKKELLKIIEGEYIPNKKTIEKYDISSKTFEKTIEIDSLIKSFINYANSTFSKVLTFEEAEKIFISYLKENDKDILIAAQDISLLPDVDSSKEKKYIINRFVKYVFENNYSDYKLITQIISGYILANCIFYDEPTNYKGKLKGVKIYLDTRVILRLVGLEGEFREQSYSDFLNLLKEKGAIISIFEHTKDEVKGIIEDCVNWINNLSYKPALASPVLRHFVENNFDKDSVRLFISKIDSFLIFNEIEAEPVPSAQDLIEYQIDEAQLFEIIKHLYCISNNFYEDPSKDEVIYKDVKSISAIYKIRKGKKPNYIKDSVAIFLTTNNSLAKANYKFNIANNINGYSIKECLTDVFLGTSMWSDNPVKFSEFQEKKIIANCIASLAPDELLIKKYTKSLEKLEKDKRITSNELYFLKTHKLVNNTLSEKAFNDENNFYDKLPEEILDEIKNAIKAESNIELDKEKHKHSLTQDELNEKEDILKNTKIEKNDLISQNIQYDIKISAFAQSVSKYTIKILFGVVIPLVIFGFALTVFPDIISNKVLRYILIALALVLSVLGSLYGFSIKGFFKQLENRLKIFIRNLILK